MAKWEAGLQNQNMNHPRMLRAFRRAQIFAKRVKSVANFALESANQPTSCPAFSLPFPIQLTATQLIEHCAGAGEDIPHLWGDGACHWGMPQATVPCVRSAKKTNDKQIVSQQQSQRNAIVTLNIIKTFYT